MIWDFTTGSSTVTEYSSKKNILKRFLAVEPVAASSALAKKRHMILKNPEVNECSIDISVFDISVPDQLQGHCRAPKTRMFVGSA